MDSGFSVPADSVIIQAVMGVMAVKGKKCFVREQRQGELFIRVTLTMRSARGRVESPSTVFHREYVVCFL